MKKIILTLAVLGLSTSAMAYQVPNYDFMELGNADAPIDLNEVQAYVAELGGVDATYRKHINGNYTVTVNMADGSTCSFKVKQGEVQDSKNCN